MLVLIPGSDRSRLAEIAQGEPEKGDKKSSKSAKKSADATAESAEVRASEEVRASASPLGERPPEAPSEGSGKSAEGKSAEGKSAEGKPAEGKSAEGKSAERRSRREERRVRVDPGGKGGVPATEYLV